MATTPADRSSTDYTPGDMPIVEHQATFHGVMKLMKWGSLYLAALLVLLVMWFCTPAGFVPALIVAVLVAALGTLVLSDKRTPVI